MTKELFLIRHAKSDWNDPAMKDFDRPLNERGKKAAPEMGRRLLKKKIAPDAIYSSPAKRALTTARKIADEIRFDKSKIIQKEDIYEAGIRELVRIVNSFPADKHSVFLVGHNPGMTDFANYITGTDIINIPTCGIVHITFSELNWNEISAGTGDLVEFDYPKKQPDED